MTFGSGGGQKKSRCGEVNITCILYIAKQDLHRTNKINQPIK